MSNVIPTEDELLAALEQKRRLAANQRQYLATRWKKHGVVALTPELAHEIREYKVAHPDAVHREIAAHFNVSSEKVGRVLRNTIFPER